LCEQEWNEVLFNGVYWEPPEVGAPGEVHTDKKYTFKYPRPPRYAQQELVGWSLLTWGAIAGKLRDVQ
jgi:hypothetical protein